MLPLMWKAPPMRTKRMTPTLRRVKTVFSLVDSFIPRQSTTASGPVSIKKFSENIFLSLEIPKVMPNANQSTYSARSGTCG